MNCVIKRFIAINCKICRGSNNPLKILIFVSLGSYNPGTIYYQLVGSIPHTSPNVVYPSVGRYRGDQCCHCTGRRDVVQICVSTTFVLWWKSYINREATKLLKVNLHCKILALIYINKRKSLSVSPSGFSPFHSHYATEGLSGPHHAENECRCSLVFFAAAPSPPPPTQAARTCQKPPGRANRSCWQEAASHWLRGSGGGRCPVTWRHTWGALTAHVATPKSSCWLSYIPSMPTFIVKRGSDGQSQSCKRAIVISKRDGANVTIDIIYIYILLSFCMSQFSPGRKVENWFCTVLYRYLHFSPNTGQARRRILLSLIHRCSFPFSVRHRPPEPARNHRARPITAPDRRQPLIGREVQAAAGVLWRDVTHEEHSQHMLPHQSPAVDWATLQACRPL